MLRYILGCTGRDENQENVTIFSARLPLASWVRPTCPGWLLSWAAAANQANSVLIAIFQGSNKTREMPTLVFLRDLINIFWQASPPCSYESLGPKHPTLSILLKQDTSHLSVGFNQLNYQRLASCYHIFDVYCDLALSRCMVTINLDIYLGFLFK